MPPEMVRRLRERPFYPYLFESIARDVAVSVLDLRPGERVLDVGLRTGETLLKLTALTGPTGRATGVDASAENRALAEARLREAGFSNFEIAEGAPKALCAPVGPLRPASFEAAYAAFSFGALDDEGVTEALKELRRCLRPGGRAAIAGLTLGEHFAPSLVARALGALTKVRPNAETPRRLQPLAARASFSVERRLYLEQRGVPSEVLLLRRRDSVGAIL